jgi:hypothetical protein
MVRVGCFLSARRRLVTKSFAPFRLETSRARPHELARRLPSIPMRAVVRRTAMTVTRPTKELPCTEVSKS